MGEVGAGGAGEGNDVGHRVGVVADEVVGGVHPVAEVGAMDVPGGDGAVVVEVAQDALHAAYEGEDVAGGHAVHGFRDAPAQGVVAVEDELVAQGAKLPADRGCPVVFVVGEGPAFGVGRAEHFGGVGHVAREVIGVTDH